MVMFSTVVSAHEYTVMFITLVNGLFDHLSGKMGINVRFKLYAIIAVHERSGSQRYTATER